MTDGADELRRAYQEAEQQAKAAGRRRNETAHEEARRAEEARSRFEAEKSTAAAVATFLAAMKNAGNPGLRPCHMESAWLPRGRKLGEGWVIRETTSLDPIVMRAGWIGLSPGSAILTDGQVVECFSNSEDARIVVGTLKAGKRVGEIRAVAFTIDELARVLHRNGVKPTS